MVKKEKSPEPHKILPFDPVVAAETLERFRKILADPDEASSRKKDVRDRVWRLEKGFSEWRKKQIEKGADLDAVLAGMKEAHRKVEEQWEHPA